MNQVVTIGNREVLIANADLVSQKFIAIVGKMVEYVFKDNEKAAVHAIVLDGCDLLMTGEMGDRNTSHMMAMSYPEIGVIGVNLEETFTKAMELVKDMPNVSIFTCFWHNMLMNVIHETVHLLQMAEAADAKKWLTKLWTDEEFAKQVEKECRVTALELLDEFCQKFDSEPPAWGEESYFAMMVGVQYAGTDGQEADQIRWLNDRIMVYAEPKSIQDFRGYMACNSSNPEDEVWNQDLLPVMDNVTPVTNSFHQTLKETTTAVPVPTPEQGNNVTIDDLFEEMPEGEAAVEGGEAGFFGAFGMAEGAAMPSIPTNAPQPGQPVVPTFMTGQTPQPGATYTAQPAFTGGGAFNTTPGVQQQPQPQQSHAASQMQPVAEVYPNHGIDPQVLRDTFYGVATKCYDHFFKYCGPKAYPNTPENEYVQGFEKADAVAGIPIQLTELEKQLVVKCECYNAMGQRTEAKSTADGELRGFVTSNAKLPMYKVYLNFNGQEVVRTLVPQNPNAGLNYGNRVLTNTARMARLGNAIMFVMEGNDAVNKVNPNAKFKSKCVGGQWAMINA